MGSSTSGLTPCCSFDYFQQTCALVVETERGSTLRAIRHRKFYSFLIIVEIMKNCLPLTKNFMVIRVEVLLYNCHKIRCRIHSVPFTFWEVLHKHTDLFLVFRTSDPYFQILSARGVASQHFFSMCCVQAAGLSRNIALYAPSQC